jgi:hypothetical protein
MCSWTFCRHTERGIKMINRNQNNASKIVAAKLRKKWIFKNVLLKGEQFPERLNNSKNENN